MKYRNYSKRHDFLILMVSILVFFLAGVFRSFAGTYSFSEILVGIDDWNRYARFGVDIVENGLEIPSLHSVYLYPAGFLYNYFLAACFAIFGYQLLPIYLLQSCLLGISLALIYFIFRSYFSKKQAYLLLISLFVFGFLDIFKSYSFRLLSENLVLFTLACFFYFLQKWFKYKYVNDILLISFFGICSIFIRPNTLAFFVLLLPVIAYHCYDTKALRLQFFAFLSLTTLLFSMLFLRNYAAVGEIQFLPVDGRFTDLFFTYNPYDYQNDTLYFFLHYPKKILFIFGYLPILNESFSIRPHWFVLYGGFVIFLYFFLRKRIKMDVFQKCVLLFCFLFFGTLIGVGEIQNYGFRLIIPVICWVLPFSFLGFQYLWHRFKKEKVLKEPKKSTFQ